MTSQPCLLTAVTMTILAALGDTHSHPYVSNVISTDAAFCHSRFFLLRVGFTQPKKEKITVGAGSTAKIAAPGGSKMTIPQGLSTGKSPWSSTPPKDLVLQGIFARVGKKMETQIPLFLPPSPYTVTYSYRKLPRWASTDYDTTLSILIKHCFFSEQTPLLHRSPQQRLHRSEVFKHFTSGSQAIIINLTTTSDTVFIRNNLWGD